MIVFSGFKVDVEHISEFLFLLFVFGIGSKPCYGTKIQKGSLRLGEETDNKFHPGDIAARWRHW
jgi:hypothetical protein